MASDLSLSKTVSVVALVVCFHPDKDLLLALIRQLTPQVSKLWHSQYAPPTLGRECLKFFWDEIPKVQPHQALLLQEFIAVRCLCVA